MVRVNWFHCLSEFDLQLRQESVVFEVEEIVPNGLTKPLCSLGSDIGN
jgi:hypothetical protein